VIGYRWIASEMTRQSGREKLFKSESAFHRLVNQLRLPF
jgi:hypothetical protein